MINFLIILAFANPCYTGDKFSVKGYYRVLTKVVSYYDSDSSAGSLNSYYIRTECQAVGSLAYLNQIKQWYEGKNNYTIEQMHIIANAESIKAEVCCVNKVHSL